jgi:hypothetical protein
VRTENERDYRTIVATYEKEGEEKRDKEATRKDRGGGGAAARARGKKR